MQQQAGHPTDRREPAGRQVAVGPNGLPMQEMFPEIDRRLSFPAASYVETRAREQPGYGGTPWQPELPRHQQPNIRYQPSTMENNQSSLPGSYTTSGPIWPPPPGYPLPNRQRQYQQQYPPQYPPQYQYQQQPRGQHSGEWQSEGEMPGQQQQREGQSPHRDSDHPNMM